MTSCLCYSTIPGHPRVFRSIFAHLVIGIAGLIMLGACDRSPFECARQLSSRVDDTTRCDRPREVCVCASRQCAVPVASTDCPSGYRYTEWPFGNNRQCVSKDETLEGFADTATGQCAQPSTDGGVP